MPSTGKWYSALVFIVAVALLLLSVGSFETGHSSNMNALETTPRVSEFIHGDSARAHIKQMEDSLWNLHNWRIQQARATGGQLNIGLFGIRSVAVSANCLHGASSPGHQYYFSIPGFILEQPADEFYSRFNYYCGEGNVNLTRYAVDTDNTHPSGHLLLPVSKRLYTILQVVCWILGAVLLLTLFYLVIIRPVVLLQRIALGQIFLDDNVRILKSAGMALLGFSILSVLITLVAGWAAGSAIPQGIGLSFATLFFTWRGWMIAGIIFLLLSHAFGRGLKLQKEQELTI